MTIYHWGKSDVAFERFCRATAPSFRHTMEEWVHLILRGLIPTGVPFVGEIMRICVAGFSVYAGRDLPANLTFLVDGGQ